jgi:addiction module HigA family antidote
MKMSSLSCSFSMDFVVIQSLHIPYSRLREIVDGARGVSADTALRLERYFGSEAQGWLNLQAAHDPTHPHKPVTNQHNGL